MGILLFKISNDPHALAVRRTEEDCRQRWTLRMLKLSSSKERFRH